MNLVRGSAAAFFVLCAAVAEAGEATGHLTLAGARVELAAATAFVIDARDGKTTTLVLLSAQPIDLASVLAADDPHMALLNNPAIDAVTHAIVFVGKDRISVNAHKAGDSMQYLATQKFGLEASMSGGDGKPLQGRLRSKDREMSVQIDAEFTTDVVNTGR